MKTLLTLSALLIPFGVSAYEYSFSYFFDNEIAGYYDIESKEIVINELLEGQELIDTIVHEQGHDHFYNDMTEIQRRLYCLRFDRGSVRFPTEYSKQDCIENYAENYMLKNNIK